MHKLNILLIGSKDFISTINELKPHLKFNITSYEKNENNFLIDNFEGIIYSKNSCGREIDELIEKNSPSFKILATSSDKNKKESFDYILKLPTSVKEINDLIESAAVKKQFSKNSSIKIKSYLLDKNEKKLLKENNFIILTEKEIQLLELLLGREKSVSKNAILSMVWQYASGVDTHTVETHIYRLRKKISSKFSDDKFILSNKEGYYL